MNPDQIAAICFSVLTLGMALSATGWLLKNGATSPPTYAALSLGILSASISIYSVVIPNEFISELLSEILLKFLVPVIELLNTLALVKIISKFILNLGQTGYTPGKSKKWILAIHLLLQSLSIIVFAIDYADESTNIHPYSITITAIIFFFQSITTMISCILFLILLCLLPTSGTFKLNLCKWLISWTLLLDIISFGMIIYNLIHDSSISCSVLTTTTILKTLVIIQVCLRLPMPKVKPIPPQSQPQTQTHEKRPVSKVPGMSYFTSQLEVNESLDGLSFFGSQHNSTQITSKLSFIDRKSKLSFTRKSKRVKSEVPPVPKLDLEAIESKNHIQGHVSLGASLKVQRPLRSEGLLKAPPVPIMKTLGQGHGSLASSMKVQSINAENSISRVQSPSSKGAKSSKLQGMTIDTRPVMDTRPLEGKSPRTPRNADLSPT